MNAGVKAIFVTLLPVLARAAADFILPTSGCPMAHCDARLSDSVNAGVPPSATLRAHDSMPSGSGAGLGCASNGINVACTYQDPNSGSLVYYDATGTRLWSSSLLVRASSGAPLISAIGEVIAADDNSVIRFASNGSVIWRTATPGGISFSPVLVGGLVVIALNTGPICAYRLDDGTRVGMLQVSDPVLGSFGTVNTASAIGNMLYVALQAKSHITHGRLSAIEVDPSNPSVFREAWHYDFLGPTGGSPLAIDGVIYFDGGSLSVADAASARMYAVRDLGTSGSLLWSKQIEAGIQVSPAQDPRGGFWIWPIYRNYFQRLDQNTGVELQRIYVDPLINAIGYMPSSAMSIAITSSGNPAMVTGLTTPLVARTGYICAIDLVAGTLVWKWAIPPIDNRPDLTRGQFPILASGPTIVFTTQRAGAYFLSQ